MNISMKQKGFPGGSAGKESACKVGDLGLIPGLGRSTRDGNCYPLQYSGLETSIDCVVHGVAKSWTQRSDFYSFIHETETNSQREQTYGCQRGGTWGKRDWWFGIVQLLCPTLAIPWIVAHQAPLSMGFSRQEYWNGLPFLLQCLGLTDANYYIQNG